jgi:hypothetical protein
MFFSLVFLFQEEKNDVTAWNFSSSYCAFLDFFDIESRGAIIDEAPNWLILFFIKTVYNLLDQPWL